MERIKMTSTAAGEAGTFLAGVSYAVPAQVPAALAAEFVAAGAAAVVSVARPRAAEGEPETAVAPAAETATARPGRRGRIGGDA